MHTLLEVLTVICSLIAMFLIFFNFDVIMACLFISIAYACDVKSMKYPVQT